MRKGLIPGFGTPSSLSAPGSWFDIENGATAELSSEDPQHPFERTLRSDSTDGWKAAEPGPQLIGLRFDSPQRIMRICLQFLEEEIYRSQEVALFATSNNSPRKELSASNGYSALMGPMLRSRTTSSI
jgi:hypothetical protein